MSFTTEMNQSKARQRLSSRSAVQPKQSLWHYVCSETICIVKSAI